MRWVLVFIVIACNTAGDVLNTRGMKKHGEVEDFRPSAIRQLIRSLVRNRYVVAGVMLMAVSFFALLALLSIADLSFAVPATAASYLLETLLARHILKEHVTWKRWLGASLVACGVVLLALQ